MFAKVTSLLALTVALGGGALAVGAIPARDGTVNACFSTRTGALRVVNSTKRKCRKGERALAWSQRGPAGTPGARGVPGGPGAPGTPGTNGTNGTNGSPDTAAQVLSKLSEVDGSGSGLNADLVRGQVPAFSLSNRSSQTENGGTVSFVTILLVPGFGSLQGDCNTESDHDIRFLSSTGGLHVVVDTGAANATQASDVANGATTTPLNVTSTTAANPEFQIWHLQTGTSPAVTIFLEARPDSGSTCGWSAQAVGTAS